MKSRMFLSAQFSRTFTPTSTVKRSYATAWRCLSRASAVQASFTKSVAWSSCRSSEWMHVAAGRPTGSSVNVGVQELRRLLQRWRQDVDETMVHAFDFLYFYGKDVSRYIAGIWSSWGTIPNIGTRNSRLRDENDLRSPHYAPQT